MAAVIDLGSAVTTADAPGTWRVVHVIHEAGPHGAPRVRGYLLEPADEVAAGALRTGARLRESAAGAVRDPLTVPRATRARGAAR